MRRLLAFLLLGGICSGCALTEDKVDLDYRTYAVPPVPGAAGVTVQVDTVDRRPGDSTQVSNKKNGYGMEMAAIKANRPVAAIVQDAMVSELRTRGFTVAPAAVKVVADVVRFRNTFDPGFFSAEARSEVTLAVQVRNAAGAIVFSRTITGEGVEKGVQIMGGENAKASLEKALPDAVHRVVDDPEFLRALLNPEARPVS